MEYKTHPSLWLQMKTKPVPAEPSFLPFMLRSWNHQRIAAASVLPLATDAPGAPYPWTLIQRERCGLLADLFYPDSRYSWWASANGVDCSPRSAASVEGDWVPIVLNPNKISGESESRLTT